MTRNQFNINFLRSTLEPHFNGKGKGWKGEWATYQFWRRASALEAHWHMCTDGGLKEKGNVFLHGDLIFTYALPEYISGISVDGLCIISVKLNFEKLSVVPYLLSC